MKSSIGLTALVGSLMCISPIFGKDKLLGAFKNNFHDIAGNIYSKGDNQLVIEGFTYDGQGPDAFFWVGTKGKEPSSDGIILPHPFEGMMFIGLKPLKSEQASLFLCPCVFTNPETIFKIFKKETLN